MADETQVFVAQATVEGDAEIARLADGVEDVAQSFDKARDARGRFVAGARQDFAAVGSAASSSAAGVGSLETKLGAAGREAGRAKYNLAAIGGTLDDLQYVGEQGLRPILNNIMAISPAAGIALLAIQQIITHWDTLTSALGSPAVKTAAQEMEELGKKTAKTAEETAKLARYKREQATVESIKESPTSAESAQSKAVKEAFVEAPAANVRDAIRKIYGKEVDNTTPEDLRQEQRKARGELDSAISHGMDPETIAVYSDRLSAVEAKIQKRIEDWIDQFEAAVAHDPKALKAFTGRLADSGMLPELVPKLRDAQVTPDQKAAKEKQKSADEKDDAAYEEWRQLQESNYQAKLSKFREGVDKANAERDEETSYEEFRQEQENKYQIGLAQHEEDAYQRRQRAAIEKSDEDDANRAHLGEVEAKRAAGVKSNADMISDGNVGLDESIRATMTAMMLGGANQNEAGAWAVRQMSGRYGADVAGELVGRQSNAATRDAMEMAREKPEQRRNSAVIDAAAMAAQIQSAVGGADIDQRQLQEMQRQTALFTQFVGLARQRGNGLRFGGDGNLGGN